MPVLVSARGTIPGFDRSRNKRSRRERRGWWKIICEDCEARWVRKKPPEPAHRVSATVTKT